MKYEHETLSETYCSLRALCDKNENHCLAACICPDGVIVTDCVLLPQYCPLDPGWVVVLDKDGLMNWTDGATDQNSIRLAARWVRDNIQAWIESLHCLSAASSLRT